MLAHSLQLDILCSTYSPRVPAHGAVCLCSRSRDLANVWFEFLSAMRLATMLAPLCCRETPWEQPLVFPLLQ